MFGRRPKVRDFEISPDEIFLDATGTDFNQASLEGRLEKPLSRGTYCVWRSYRSHTCRAYCAGSSQGQLTGRCTHNVVKTIFCVLKC